MTERRRNPRSDPRVLAAIACGGAIGATARYEMTVAMPVRAGHFPWATLLTNVTGSFVLGVVVILFLERFAPTRYLQPFVVTGVLGAYTTYSAFAVETDLLIKDAHAATAAVYVIATLVAGFAAVTAGIWVGRSFTTRERTSQ